MLRTVPENQFNPMLSIYYYFNAGMEVCLAMSRTNNSLSSILKHNRGALKGWNIFSGSVVTADTFFMPLAQTSGHSLY